MTYSPEPATAAQIQAGAPFDECVLCGREPRDCTCTPQQRLDAVVIAAEFDEIVAEMRAKWPAPRDSMPLAGYTGGWSK